MTTQRAVILEELKKSKDHPTADEVYSLVKRRLPRVSLATVYRNLDLLTQAGMIQTVELGGCPRRYDGWTEDHIHVRCVECGRVEDVRDGIIGRARDRAAKISGYNIDGHHIEFTGYCPACNKKAGRSSAKTGNERRRRNAGS
jgi:Fur family ferric uptake transcriptional regulator